MNKTRQLIVTTYGLRGWRVGGHRLRVIDNLVLGYWAHGYLFKFLIKLPFKMGLNELINTKLAHLQECNL
jgi:hypothetical protein